MTEPAIAPARDAEADRARVRALLDRQDVQVQLEAYGITVDQARARVDSLTDDEVALIAGQLDELPAGGAGGAWFEGLALVFTAAVLVAGLAVFWLLMWIGKKASNGSKKKAD